MRNRATKGGDLRVHFSVQNRDTVTVEKVAAYDGLVDLGGRPRLAGHAAYLVAGVIEGKDRIEHILDLRGCRKSSDEFEFLKSQK